MGRVAEILDLPKGKSPIRSPLYVCSQRQLRLGLEFLVRPSVRWSTLFPENRSKDFAETWHECSLL